MIRDMVVFLLFGGWRCWRKGHRWYLPPPGSYEASVNRGWPFGWQKADGWCERCTKYHYIEATP